MFKKSIPFLLLSTLVCLGTANAQITSFGLSGNPVNTSGWNLMNDSYINATEVVLTDGQTDQAGQIYYLSSKNVSRCSQFTVNFDFKISNPNPDHADGIAFWVTNGSPVFNPKQSLGLPFKPEGLVLAFDTYDWNNGQPAASDFPRISLRHLMSTNYVEKSTTGLLAPDAINQDFLVDGEWHSCEIKYSFGTVTVRFDGQPPLMIGTTNLSLPTAYFGFSGGTSTSSSSEQVIRNVSIRLRADVADAPITDTVVYCQYEQAEPLFAYPNTNLRWYTTPSGGLALPSAPTPSTDSAGYFHYYVERDIPNCNMTSMRGAVVVKIIEAPKKPDIDIPVYCSGQIGLAIQNPLNSFPVSWYTNIGDTTGTVTPPRPSTDSARSFLYYVTQTDTITGCKSKKEPIIIDIHQAPEVDFDYTIGLGCVGGDTVYFKDKSKFVDNYFWDLGVAGAKSALPNPSFLYKDEGTYFVKLLGKNEFCTDSIIKTIGLGHPLVADFTQSADTICQGTTVRFNNESIATVMNDVAPRYNYFFGDRSSSNLESPTYTFNKAGTYTVTLVVSNGIPCYDTMKRIIVVDSLSPIFIQTLDTPICQGDEIKFISDYAVNNSGLNSSYWNFGDGTDSVFDMPPVWHAFDKAGKFKVTLTNKYRACPDSAVSIDVRINPMPYLDIGGDTSLCLNGDVITLKDAINANNPKARWEWSTGDTTSSSNLTQPGHYWAKVTIDNCTTRDEIVVEKDCYLDVPNVFTPNDDGNNDYFLPRQLMSQGVSTFKMTIYNRWGQVVYETNSINGRGWDGRFNGKQQPLGVYVYLIEAEYKNGRTESYKGNLTLIR